MPVDSYFWFGTVTALTSIGRHAILLVHALSRLDMVNVEILVVSHIGFCSPTQERMFFRYLFELLVFRLDLSYIRRSRCGREIEGVEMSKTEPGHTFHEKQVSLSLDSTCRV